MSVELAGVSAGPLAGVSVTFDAGLHVVLGQASDGAAVLVELIAGLVAPRAGSVRVDGKDPRRSPETRARIGALLEHEPVFPARDLAGGVSNALALRGGGGEARALLESHGLAGVAAMRAADAPPELRRHVALALALELAKPAALVLFEPLATGALSSRDQVRARLVERAADGVPVIALTASPRDASELGGSLVLLDRGRFVRRPRAALPSELTPNAPLALRVRASDVQKLVARLATDPAVSGLDWDASGAADEVLVRGADANSLALAVMAAARELDVTVSAIEPVLPALEEVRAANVALWRAAYDAAYRAGRDHAEKRAAAPKTEGTS